MEEKGDVGLCGQTAPATNKTQTVLVNVLLVTYFYTYIYNQIMSWSYLGMGISLIRYLADTK